MRLPLLFALFLLVTGTVAAEDMIGWHVDGPGGFLPVEEVSTSAGLVFAPVGSDIQVTIRTYGMDRPFDAAEMDADWDLLFTKTEGPRLPDLWGNLTRLQRGEFTLDELMVIVGVAWGYNVSKDGIVTLPGGDTDDLRRWATC